MYNCLFNWASISYYEQRGCNSVFDSSLLADSLSFNRLPQRKYKDSFTLCFASSLRSDENLNSNDAAVAEYPGRYVKVHLTVTGVA